MGGGTTVAYNILIWATMLYTFYIIYNSLYIDTHLRGIYIYSTQISVFTSCFFLNFLIPIFFMYWILN